MEASSSFVYDYHHLFHRGLCPVRFYPLYGRHRIEIAFNRGWDQTGSNGANLSFPQEFGIGHGETEGQPDQDRDNWLVGLVNAAPYIGSALM